MEIKTNGPSYFLPGDIVRFPNTGEVMVITSIRHWLVRAPVPGRAPRLGKRSRARPGLGRRDAKPRRIVKGSISVLRNHVPAASDPAG